MKKALLAICASFVFTACGKEAGTDSGDAPAPTPDEGVLVIKLEWDKAPVANTEKNAAILQVGGKGKIEVKEVDPQMPAHGHGTVTSYQKVEPVACADEKSTCFEITGFFFVMPGEWEINVSILRDGTVEKRTFPVEVK